MPTFRRTEAAAEDIRRIATHIGLESGRPDLAEKIVDELIDCCKEIARLSPMSRVGTSAEALAPGLRMYSYKRWVILFRYVKEGILVLRIADGSQDYWSWQW